MSRSNRKRKKRYQRKRPVRLSVPRSLRSTSTKPTTGIKDDDKSKDIAPLTYPPHLLKKDLIKTLIITTAIIAVQFWLYYLNQTGQLENLLTQIG